MTPAKDAFTADRTRDVVVGGFTGGLRDAIVSDIERLARLVLPARQVADVEEHALGEVTDAEVLTFGCEFFGMVPTAAHRDLIRRALTAFLKGRRS